MHGSLPRLLQVLLPILPKVRRVAVVPPVDAAVVEARDAAVVVAAAPVPWRKRRRRRQIDSRHKGTRSESRRPMLRMPKPTLSYDLLKQLDWRECASRDWRTAEMMRLRHHAAVVAAVAFRRPRAHFSTR